MPLPNLLQKHGIEAGPAKASINTSGPKKSGIPNLIETKYKNFQNTAPAPIPPQKPSLLKRAGSAVSKFLAGAAEDPVYNTGSKKEIAKNLPGEIVRTILPGAAELNDMAKRAEQGDEDAISTLTELKNRGVVNELPGAVAKTGFEMFVNPLASGSATFYGATSQLQEKAGLPKAPGVGEDGRVNIKTPIGDFTNVQERIAKEVEDKGAPTTDLGTAASVAKHTGFELLNMLYTASMAGKVVNPRLSRLTNRIRANLAPRSQAGPKTGQLYDPQEIRTNQPVRIDEFNKIVSENRIPVKTNFNENHPIIFIAKGNKGRFYQLKPSFLDEFISRFKGDPTKIPTNQLVPVTAEIAAPKPVVPPSTAIIPPKTPVSTEKPVEAPPVKVPPETIPTSSKPPVVPGNLTIKPEVTTKEVVPPGRLPQPVVKIGDQTVARPPQLVTKSEVKDMIAGLGKESVTFNVQDIDGKKYMVYVDESNNIKLRPSALGLAEVNIVPGQQITLNAQDLKTTGRGFQAVTEAGEIQASVAKSETNPAKSPQDLAERIEQLNKLGQSQRILRKTGGVSKKHLGHFASGPKATKIYKAGKIELRDETVKNQQSYMSTLAHELGHGIEHKITGATNQRTYEVFGRNLTKEQLKTIDQELRAVTNELVGELTASANPSYYHKKTELLARFFESIFTRPGGIEDVRVVAPESVALFEKMAMENPIISEFMEAVAGTIDKGQLKHILWRDLREIFQKKLGKRNGDQAYFTITRLNQMRGRTEAVMSKLVDEKFTGKTTKLQKLNVFKKDKIQDSQEDLFNAIESIKVTKDGEPEFGTRFFLNAKNKKEIADLEENGYRPLIEDGEQVFDLIHGERLPRYFKVRYTPEQAQAFFDKLSPAGKELVKDFTAARDEAKDFFNRETVKFAYNVNGNIEGWIHHYGFPERKSFGLGGDRFKFKTAAARKQRQEVEGYTKEVREGMKKVLTEFQNEKDYNNFLKDFIPLVTRPIGDKELPLPGWVRVEGGIERGGIHRPYERNVMMKDKSGKPIPLKQPQYQMPKEIYDQFKLIRDGAEEATNMMRIARSAAGVTTANILLHPGSITTNVVGGGLLGTTKILEDFYRELFTGKVGFPQTRRNIFGAVKVLLPAGWDDAPDWGYGGQRTAFYGQFAEKAPGMNKGGSLKLRLKNTVKDFNKDKAADLAEQAAEEFTQKGLYLYGLTERYFKKWVSLAEGAKDLKSLEVITKDGLRDLDQMEKELLDEITEAVDRFTLDYNNVAPQLAAWNRNPAGRTIKPFTIYLYKIAKFMLDRVQGAFDGTIPAGERFYRLAAFATMMTLMVQLINQAEDKSETPKPGVNTPSAVDPSSKLYIGKADDGQEKFTKMSKHAYFAQVEIAMNLKNREYEAAWRNVQDFIGSLGPVGALGAMLLGYRKDFQQYMDPGAIVGQTVKPIIPAFRIWDDIAAYYDPYQRKQTGFLQGFTSGSPLHAPLFTDILGWTDREEQLEKRGEIRKLQVPLEGGVQPFGDIAGEGKRRTTSDMYLRNYKEDILKQLFLGIYIRRIDPDIAEAFKIREEANALKKSGGSSSPFGQ
jgi:hypothetical protein